MVDTAAWHVLFEGGARSRQSAHWAAADILIAGVQGHLLHIVTSWGHECSVGGELAGVIVGGNLIRAR